MFTRRSVLTRPTYWLTKARLDFMRVLEDHMATNNIKRKELADNLKCSSGYVSQMLNGDTNVSLSKLFDVALKIGKVPFIRYEDLEIVIARDAIMCEDSYEEAGTKFDSMHLVRKVVVQKFSVVESLEEIIA